MNNIDTSCFSLERDVSHQCSFTCSQADGILDKMEFFFPSDMAGSEREILYKGLLYLIIATVSPEVEDTSVVLICLSCCMFSVVGF